MRKAFKGEWLIGEQLVSSNQLHHKPEGLP